MEFQYHNIKKISQVKNGQLVKCETCNIYHLIFNNILYEFDLYEFESFKQYVMDIEVDFWEQQNVHVNMTRKIPIPTSQDNLVILFDKQEIEDLKKLISIKISIGYQLINPNGTDYSYLLN